MIVIGCDHGGFELKEILVKYLNDKGLDLEDVGAYSADSVDYPDIAKKVCTKIQNKEAEFGILICGTGVGMSICANKYKGIRAALCSDTFSARMTRCHNNSNVLTLGARVIGSELAKDIVDQFLNNEFEGGRHAIRVNKITDVENM